MEISFSIRCHFFSDGRLLTPWTLAEDVCWTNSEEVGIHGCPYIYNRSRRISSRRTYFPNFFFPKRMVFWSSLGFSTVYSSADSFLAWRTFPAPESAHDFAVLLEDPVLSALYFEDHLIRLLSRTDLLHRASGFPVRREFRFGEGDLSNSQPWVTIDENTVGPSPF